MAEEDKTLPQLLAEEAQVKCVKPQWEPKSTKPPPSEFWGIIQIYSLPGSVGSIGAPMQNAAAPSFYSQSKPDMKKILLEWLSRVLVEIFESLWGYLEF